MPKHSRPKKTMIPFYAHRDEVALIRAIRAYRDGHMEWATTEHLYYTLVPTGAHVKRHRQPGRHAQRWDAA